MKDLGLIFCKSPELCRELCRLGGLFTLPSVSLKILQQQPTVETDNIMLANERQLAKTEKQLAHSTTLSTQTSTKNRNKKTVLSAEACQAKMGLSRQVITRVNMANAYTTGRDSHLLLALKPTIC